MNHKKRWDYKTCPICGASLDVGEECDCMWKNPPAESTQERQNRSEPYKTIAKPKPA